MQTDACVSEAIMQMFSNGVWPGRACVRAQPVWVLLQNVACGGCRCSVSRRHFSPRVAKEKARKRQSEEASVAVAFPAALSGSAAASCMCAPKCERDGEGGTGTLGEKHPLLKMFLDTGRRKEACA